MHSRAHRRRCAEGSRLAGEGGFVSPSFLGVLGAVSLPSWCKEWREGGEIGQRRTARMWRVGSVRLAEAVCGRGSDDGDESERGQCIDLVLLVTLDCARWSEEGWC